MIIANVWNEYSKALFDSIRLTVRYESSLKAWLKLIEEVDDSIKDTLIMDYVSPVLEAANDIPNRFRDQLIRGGVKLTGILMGEYKYIRLEKDGRTKRPYWFKEYEKIRPKRDASDALFNIIEQDSYNSSDAKFFREKHGITSHDSSPNLVENRVSVCEIDSGLQLLYVKKSLNLEAELEAIDRYRRKMQEAYVVFNEYAEESYETLK